MPKPIEQQENLWNSICDKFDNIDIAERDQLGKERILSLKAHLETNIYLDELACLVEYFEKNGSLYVLFPDYEFRIKLHAYRERLVTGQELDGRLRRLEIEVIHLMGIDIFGLFGVRGSKFAKNSIPVLRRILMVVEKVFNHLEDDDDHDSSNHPREKMLELLAEYHDYRLRELGFIRGEVQLNLSTGPGMNEFQQWLSQKEWWPENTNVSTGASRLISSVTERKRKKTRRLMRGMGEVGGETRKKRKGGGALSIDENGRMDMNRVERRKGLDSDAEDLVFDADHYIEHDCEQDAFLTDPTDNGRSRMEEPNDLRDSVESELDIEYPRSARSEMRSSISNGNYEFVDDGETDESGSGSMKKGNRDVNVNGNGKGFEDELQDIGLDHDSDEYEESDEGNLLGADDHSSQKFRGGCQSQIQKFANHEESEIYSTQNGDTDLDRGSVQPAGGSEEGSNSFSPGIRSISKSHTPESVPGTPISTPPTSKFNSMERSMDGTMDKDGTGEDRNDGGEDQDEEENDNAEMQDQYQSFKEWSDGVWKVKRELLLKCSCVEKIVNKYRGELEKAKEELEMRKKTVVDGVTRVEMELLDVEVWENWRGDLNSAIEKVRSIDKNISEETRKMLELRERLELVEKGIREVGMLTKKVELGRAVDASSGGE
ncbi:hypothetical protein BGAL_0559g00040 [Botrytis galanthina]|uniref:Uncharacterized protein n=1 Tax=Botrytis galanthina TaxID=278940 RepID=A0A4S8QVV3_9HELO|nr:hypothetical protein BGAL_0559g00040 [Botrytis galanthina]